MTKFDKYTRNVGSALYESWKGSIRHGNNMFQKQKNKKQQQQQVLPCYKPAKAHFN